MCKLDSNGDEYLKVFDSGNKSVTDSLDSVAERVVKYMIEKDITLSTAESCTGGLLSELITNVSGASSIFKGSICSYSEEVKIKLLGVKKSTIKSKTVYSSEVASEMSDCIRRLMDTDSSIGVTGIAGPSGGSDEKPVGTVYVSVRYKDCEIVKNLKLYNELKNMDRKSIRLKTAEYAFLILEKLIKKVTVDDK